MEDGAHVAGRRVNKEKWEKREKLRKASKQIGQKGKERRVHSGRTVCVKNLLLFECVRIRFIYFL